MKFFQGSLRLIKWSQAPPGYPVIYTLQIVNVIILTLCMGERERPRGGTTTRYTAYAMSRLAWPLTCTSSLCLWLIYQTSTPSHQFDHCSLVSWLLLISSQASIYTASSHPLVTRLFYAAMGGLPALLRPFLPLPPLQTDFLVLTWLIFGCRFSSLPQ